MDKLIVICEGGVHTVEYLHRNGIFPSAMVIEPNKFQEMSPYLTKDDDILLIIKGLTDFTMSSIYGLMSKFKEYESKFKRVTILTNIPLGVVPYEYYLYSGDLFFGQVKKVASNKIYDLDSNGNTIETQKKLSFTKRKKEIESYNRNPIIFQFKKYNDKKTKIMIYGDKKTKILVDRKVNPEHAVTKNFEYEEKIKLIDLYDK